MPSCETFDLIDLAAMSDPHANPPSRTVYYVEDRLEPSLSSTESTLFQPSICGELDYLDEGGANFIFRLSPCPSPLPGIDVDATNPLQGRLLRLRKDIPLVASTTTQYEAFNSIFAPIFPPENLVQLQRVRLDTDLRKTINCLLQSHPNRPLQRQQDFFAETEEFGFLIEDLSPDSDEQLLQLKPKWLIQSRNAPPSATRCRTCALRAQRASRHSGTATDAQTICPLELVSENLATRTQAAARLTQDDHLREYLVCNAPTLLRLLRDRQERLDRLGVIGVAEGDDLVDLCTAMTLRDCTLFIKKKSSWKGGGVEARLADLDLKSPLKVTRWREVERGLIDEGWYVNGEPEEVWRREKVCLLSRRDPRR